MPGVREQGFHGPMARRSRTRSLPSPSDGGAVVRAEEVGAAEGEVELLSPVSLRVDAGEVLALRGHNGSGKTTLLRLLAGLRRPSTGSVEVLGHAPDDRDPALRAALAALIGPPQTARDLTVREHLRFLSATWGRAAGPAQEEADALLEELALTPLAARFPHELSSGQSQLLALALTLGRPSRVLLLDEPEQRLDPDRLTLVADALRARAGAGTAIVLASHSAALVDSLATAELTLTAAGTVGSAR